MIRRSCVWMVIAAFAIGSVAPALAQTSAPAPAAPKASEPAKATDGAQKAAVKAAPKAKKADGAVKSTSAESLTLVAKDKKEWTFVLTKETKFTRGGKAIEAKTLTDKDSVSVTYSEADGKMTAKTVSVKAVSAKAAPAPKAAEAKPKS